MPPCKETMEFPQESSTTPGHRKVTNGQTRNEFEGGSTSPAHVVWGPYQGDRKAPQTGPGASREHLGCRAHLSRPFFGEAFLDFPVS
ncbi:uncharacterized protein SLC30A4-AS1 [Symphalangus syndactylus]|uniref:uncharacterized protein SLC30A4-AS1 n=1 Tax=Symphalangus syndactylus TaxID=9590 RepID=UPI0024422E51|nr:uncharacterized protein SLC30A4-AS1 [Symphalangus syndactylus]